MKRFFISVLASAGFLFPLIAQVDHDYRVNDESPVESLTLKKEQVPAAIVNAVATDFARGQALTWGKFPYALEKYGWVVNPSAAGEKPDHYEVLIKSNEGDIYAVYKPDGTIVQSRSVYKNISLPETVKISLANSPYKDWKVVGDKEIIKYYIDKSNVEEHFRVTLEKNNVKRTVSFNYKEPANK